ncbi:MAG: redox-sensitive bicupin YhaK (pirin superfamily) [Woeseiaceae bacterium]
MNESQSDYRKAVRVVEGMPTMDGAGVKLTRVIGTPELQMVDPFLLLDSFESDKPGDYIAGFPSHPHRGFETVTYMLAGQMRHEDNQGHNGVIGPGGIQWMTAGRGIVHSEMPEQKEGLLHGFQLWVNLPASDKMTEPQYREYADDAIPKETRDDNVEVRVIAGTTSLGTSGPVTGVVTDPLYLDIRLPQKTTFSEKIPLSHNAFVYVVSGEVFVAEDDDQNGQVVGERSLAVLDGGERAEIVGLTDKAHCLLVTGRSLDEPVARAGPFVMNTRAELAQAARDYQSGNL